MEGEPTSCYHYTLFGVTRSMEQLSTAFVARTFRVGASSGSTKIDDEGLTRKPLPQNSLHFTTHIVTSASPAAADDDDAAAGVPDLDGKVRIATSSCECGNHCTVCKANQNECAYAD